MKVREFRVRAIIILAVLVMATQSEAGEVSDAVQSSKYKSNGVERAFVFVDGRYLEPPYTVTAKEGRVMVNGINVIKWSDWPPRLDSPEKPQIPEDVLKKAKSFYDLDINDGSGDGWSARMIRWIYKSATNGANPREQEIIFLKSLPFVKRLDDLGNGKLRIETSDGKVWPVMTFGIPPGFETQEDVEKRVKRSAETLQELLDKGSGFLFFPPAQQLELGGGPSMVADVALMCEVLSSDRDNEKKLDVLERMGMIPPHLKREGNALVANFRASEGLTRRINKLLDMAGIKPRGIECVPAVSPAVVEELRIKERLRRLDDEQKAKDTQGTSPKQGDQIGRSP